ncbi:MAG: ERCC4 domain-containing protein [Sarcina sp.]
MKDKEIKAILNSIIIIIDSQEKKNSHIRLWLKQHKIPHIRQSLDFCDYTFMLPKNEKLGITEDTYFNNIIAIERKNSLDEISQNFTAYRERFNKEFTKAHIVGCDITLMIEESTYGDIPKHSYDSEMSEESMTGSIHGFRQKYDLPFIFVPKVSSGHFIYHHFYYWLRNKLNNLKRN